MAEYQTALVVALVNELVERLAVQTLNDPPSAAEKTRIDLELGTIETAVAVARTRLDAL